MELHGRNAASPDFDAPFAAGLGSAGIIPHDEDGDYRDTGSGIRFDLGDGSIEGMSDLNDVSGNPEVYNGPANADELADLSEGGIGGMTIMHVNDIEHGTGALPEEVKEHEAKRTAQRVHFKKTEGNPLLEPAPRKLPEDQKDKRRVATRGSGGSVRSGASAQNPNSNKTKSETTVNTSRGVGAKKTSEKGLTSKTSSKARITNNTSKSRSGSTNKSVRAVAEKATSKKGAAKKTAVKKTASKKSSTKKPSAKKSPLKKATSKQSASTKSSRGASKKNSRSVSFSSRRSR